MRDGSHLLLLCVKAGSICADAWGKCYAKLIDGIEALIRRGWLRY